MRISKKITSMINEGKEKNSILSEKLEEIALKASYMPEFIGAVANAGGRLKAIQNVRGLLDEHFPEIQELPKPSPLKEKEGALRLKNPLGGTISNEFKIARTVVNLLWKEK